MKKHYLVTKTTLFFDPHGEADFVGVEKKVEFTDEYNDLDLSLTYNEYLEEVNEDEYEGSEDGYNSKYEELEIEEITKEQFEEYGKIIDSYNKL